MVDPIRIFHSKEKDRFDVVATTNPSQATTAWYVILKSGLTMDHAKRMAQEVRNLMSVENWDSYIGGFEPGKGT